MKVIAVIPARYNSQRFPGKPIFPIKGKPMIQWVWEGIKKANSVEDIIIATDDKRIEDVVKSFGGKVFLTSSEHKSGSDRIGEVLKYIHADIVVNVQCDEPMIDGMIIDKLVEEMIKDENADIVTPYVLSSSPGDENIVKIVIDQNSYALYFSRSPIPYYFDDKREYLIHKGIYVYRNDFLKKFISSPQSYLEKSERLEQLRALYIGGKIKVVKIEKNLISVDRIEDIKKVEVFL
uniref:3-deoxy-manno-octulosonate cytidylyltransferase n=1 Tax=candidate division WOR-3 bacterium TaxID=2052148 RepID=A0A7C4U838_UNCW3